VSKQALVVEDDPDIVELVSHYLAADGWSVEACHDGRRALERLHAAPFQILILDLQLPGMDGLALCREVRRDERLRDVPIVMLTARSEEADRIVGLELGADDYIVKPFSPKELVARIHSLFRRLERQDAAARLVFGPVELDRERHTVRLEGVAVRLTAKEFALLAALIDARGRVLSRQTLLEQIWGYSYAEGTRTIDVHIRRLREKLPALAPHIRTVKSLGYRLAEEAE